MEGRNDIFYLCEYCLSDLINCRLALKQFGSVKTGIFLTCVLPETCVLGFSKTVGQCCLH